MRAVQLISTRLDKIPVGTPFTPHAFVSLGSRNNISKVLERLVKVGKIKRLLRGVYVCPEINKYIGEVTPSLAQILQTIAATTGEVLELHGAESAKQLGLTTQSPVKPIFLTSGRSRLITIGNRKVEFRHASPKKLILAGTQAGLALTALWYLGKKEVNEKTIAKLKTKLPAKEFETLLEKKECMPAWMAEIIMKFEQQ